MNRFEYETIARQSRTGRKVAQRFTVNGQNWAVSRHGVTRLHPESAWVIQRPRGAEIASALDCAAFCRRTNPHHPGARELLKLARSERLK